MSPLPTRFTLLAIAVAAQAALPSAAQAQTSQAPAAAPTRAAGTAAAPNRAAGNAAAKEEEDDTRLERIVVTARRVLEVGQDVPVALTALSADSLRKQQALDLESLNLSVPNVTIVRNTGTTVGAQVYMRGIGNDDSSFTLEPPIGIYLDDVYIGRQVGAMLDILDFERLEFLRGPQGTLYGRNSSGGAIKYQSRRPRLGQNETRVGVGGGSLSRRDFNLSTNIAAGESVAVKFDVGSRRQDGWARIVDATGAATGQRGNAVDSQAARLSTAWVISERTDLFASLDGARNASGPQVVISTNCTGLIGAGVPPSAPNSAFNVVCPYRFGPRSTGNGAPDINQHASWGGNVTLNHDMGFATLKSITGVRGFHDDLALDLSGNPAAPFNLIQYLKQRQFSQEVQLASNKRTGLRWIAGIFYFRENIDQEAVFSGVRNVDTQKATSAAVFGEVYLPLAERLTLTVGGRASQDDKEIDRRFFRPATDTTPVATLPPGPNSYSGSKFTPRLALDFKLDRDVLLYASAGSGYRAGGFGAARPTAAAQLGGQVQAETAQTVELGVKSELLDRTVRLNAAVFASKYKNLQSSVLGADGSFSVVSGDVSFSGAELEAAWRPTRGLSLYALAGLLRDEWDRPPPNVPTAVRLKHAPRQQYKIGGDYTLRGLLGGEMVFTANYRHSDEIYRSTANHLNIRSPAYGVLDAQLSWQTPDRRYRVALGGTNLSDKVVATQGVSTLGRYLGPPRQYSLSLAAAF